MLSVIVSLAGLTAPGQKGVCKVGSINFRCPSPKYYPEVKINDPKIRLFKYRDGEDKVYFFMADSESSAEPTVLTKLVPGWNESFEWEPEKNPLVMDLNTKYKFDLVAVFGLSDKRLIEIKTFAFAVNDKKFILGYISDWSEDPAANRAVFRAGTGISDNASACNEVVTALNSVTHEFKERDQGCTLTTLGPAN